MSNIMIVDDSPIIRQSLRAILEGLGHRIVKEAPNGKEALEFYEGNDIDLVTMDIEMPGINGIEVVRLIREQDPSAVIVMVSSVEDRGKVFEAIKLGAKHYFVKPFSEDKVKEVVNRVLGEETQAVAAESGQAQNNTARSKQAAANFHNSDLAALPFELFHTDDRTVLIIRRPITDEHVHRLHECLKGLLYFQKMKFVAEFWEPVHHDKGNCLLLDFMSIVRERKGKIAVVTDNSAYYAQMLSKLRDDVYRTYKDIKW